MSKKADEPVVRCNACGEGPPDASIQAATIEGINVFMCTFLTPCLARARVRRMGMWAK
jgi:hypothetical protein